MFLSFFGAMVFLIAPRAEVDLQDEMYTLLGLALAPLFRSVANGR